MAGGKTTLGRALATAVPVLEFIDLDEAVEAEAGCSVSEIFAEKGEEAFRDLESAVLRRVSRPGTVVACGGGTPCRKENADYMLATGTVVRLDADADTIVRRLLEAPAGKRPLVERYRHNPSALKEHVLSMLDSRREAYSVAPNVFDANRLDTLEQIDESVARFIRLYIKP